MSYQTGIDTVHLRPSARLAHTEYCSNDALRRAVKTETDTSLEDAWDMDLLWNTNDGPVSWSERGRATDMGHAEFLEGGADRREPKPCPFTSVEEVLAFGTQDEIRAEIDATLELAFDCPGFIFAVGNHIPSNVPVDNALFFFQYLREHWNR